MNGRRAPKGPVSTTLNPDPVTTPDRSKDTREHLEEVGCRLRAIAQNNEFAILGLLSAEDVLWASARLAHVAELHLRALVVGEEVAA